MVKIISGGQSGVDRAALDFAAQRDIPYGGWCPHGGRAEDYPSAPGVMATYPHLAETPSAIPEQRTAWNVRDSHATIILVRGNEFSRSPGTVLALQLAELVFLRPCMVVDISQPDAVGVARDWLSRTAAGLDVTELSLNVAGPRESQAPGIYSEAGAFLSGLLL